jgi:hypothetical protein
MSASLVAACQRQEARPGAEVDMELDEQEQVQAGQKLASLGPAASPEQRALYEGEFTASGGLGVGAGEGAWELRLARDYAEFVRPGLGEDGGVAGPRDYRAQGMRVTAGPLIVTIRAQDCPLPDGQSLPYVAHVLFEGVAYQGCATRGIIGSGERSTWAAELTELLPAIDACLARVSSSARVTQASALGDGQVGVRLRQGDGGRYGCVAAVDGSRIDAFDPLLDTDRLPGEGDPEFVRTPSAEPRAASCRTVTPTASATGETLGWLVRRTC